MEQLLKLKVNGKDHTLRIRAHQTLVEVLRGPLRLRGLHASCGIGVCGCCTVLLDGQPVPACLTLAAFAEGKEVTTIEGLATNGHLHPLQEAFIEEGAVQCGYCAPGMILSAKALLDENPAPTEEEIRAWLLGNICRCTGYIKPIQAIQKAAEKLRAGVQ